MGIIKIWLAQTRANFLVLSVVLVLIGGSAARCDGYTHYSHFILVMAGVILAHMSVNLFNEYSDFKSGIDSHTRRTPFSGGSGTLQAGLTSPQSVLGAATGTLLISFIIGLYFAYVSGPLVWIFIIAGGLTAVLYTPLLTRWPIGELLSGLTLGTFVVLGTYYVLTKTLTLPVVLISIPPGILTALLLLLNEFPDREADRRGRRRHLVIVLGVRKAAYLYVAGLVTTYVIIAGGILIGLFPRAVFLALFTIPLAVKASIIALKHGEAPERLLPALGANVAVVILTDLLLAIGYFL